MNASPIVSSGKWKAGRGRLHVKELESTRDAFVGSEGTARVIDLSQRRRRRLVHRAFKSRSEGFSERIARGSSATAGGAS